MLPATTSEPVAVNMPYGQAGESFSSPPLDANSYVERTLVSDDCWTWQLLPNGFMYKPDLANQRQPRMSVQLVNERTLGWMWEPTLGGRAGILRYGTDNEFWPQGWQVDIEGAAYPRLDGDRDMVSTDFTFGIPLTMREGPWEFKFGYNHLSSHLGDLFMLANPGYPRINYVRESLVLGLACYVSPSLRLFEEVGWAFHTDGGAEPWEFRFGVDFCTLEPTGINGAPFCAICADLRQENDYGGNIDLQTGWLWRGRTGHTLSDRHAVFQRPERAGPVLQDLRRADRRGRVVRLLDACSVDRLLGDDHVHADVVRKHGDFGKELALETNGQFRCIAADPVEQLVVVTLAVAQPAAAAVERQAGHDDQIETPPRRFSYWERRATRASAPISPSFRGPTHRSCRAGIAQDRFPCNRAPRPVFLRPRAWARTTRADFVADVEIEHQGAGAGILGQCGEPAENVLTQAFGIGLVCPACTASARIRRFNCRTSSVISRDLRMLPVMGIIP